MCCLSDLKLQKFEDNSDSSNNLKINHSENENNVVVPRLHLLCDVDTLRSLIKENKVRVVDVRKKDDYLKGHLPTAASLPLAELLSDDSPKSIVNILNNLGISDNMPVVVYDDTFGALAARVAWSFEFVGHKNISLLEVTYSGWKNLGLEIEQKPNSFAKSLHSMNIDYSIYANAEYIEDAQKDKKKVIIDSRERLNFLTEHIPNSKNIPYTMIRSENSILRKPSDLKRFLENRGIDSNSEVITYCGSVGTLSGLVFFALKAAGVSNVKLYPKSFKEWKSLGKPRIEFKDATYWDLSAE
jgi:thiosulfate/3-mercaptopyruvate sulfurtransferase